MSDLVDNINDELTNNLTANLTDAEKKKERTKQKVEEMKRKMKENDSTPNVRRERIDLNTKEDPEITPDQIDQYQTLQKFSICVNSGEMISSIFMRNANNWYSDNFVQQMWLRYMLKSDLFKIKFHKVHCSGHASKTDLKKTVETIKPKHSKALASAIFIK